MHIKETTDRFAPLSKVKLSAGDKQEILQHLRQEMTTYSATGRKHRRTAAHPYRRWMTSASAAVAGMVIVVGALAAGGHWFGKPATTASQSTNTASVIKPPQAETPTMDNTIPVTASHEHPMSIQFVNDKVGFATGYNGGKFELLKTIDGGAKWGRVGLELSVPAFDVAGYGGSQGPGSAQTYFVDAQNGWIAWIDPADPSSMKVAHTTDGAKTWTVSFSPMLPTGVVNVASIDFANATTGWILVTTQPGASAEQKHLYSTADGGKTWIPIAPSGFLPYAGIATAVSLVSPTSGWIVTANPSGPQPQLRHIMNGDTNQPQHEVPVPASCRSWDATEVNAPVFSGSNGVLTVGYTNQNQHQLLIYRTQDNGQSWTPTSPQGLDGYRGNPVVFQDTENGWTVSGQVLYATSNGGAVWHAVNSVQWHQIMQAYPVVTAIDFVNSEVGWVVVSSKDLTKTEVLKTLDGGNSWTVQ